MNDRFLNPTNAYQRLKEEFLKYGKLIIAYDFDSTVYDYHHTGETYERVIDLLRRYKDHAYLIVFTSSDEDRFEFIRGYLRENDIPFDAVNEDAPHITFTGRKLYYNIMLDDRAGLSECYDLLNRLYYEVICNDNQ